MNEEIIFPQKRKATIFKNLFFSFFIFIFVIVALVTGSYLGYIPSQGLPSVLNLRKFPEPAQPKEIKLSCNLGGNDYSIEYTLYSSINEYYKNDPQKRRKFLTGNYESFIYSDPEDKSISELVKKTKELGQQNGFSKDRIVDLLVCFTQSIPYDSDKAKVILSYPQGSPISAKDISLMVSRYPYETLYEGTGICTDKSYLLAYMLKELGYGTSIMVFDKDQHMAVGIKTPSGYTSFGSDYSFIETTNTGYKVGQLPVINRDSGEAASLEIEYMEESIDSKGLIIPNPVEGNINPPNNIILVADGNEYKRVIELAQRKDQIKDLINNINDKDQEIKNKRIELDLLAQLIDKKETEVKRAEDNLKTAEDNYKQNPTPKNYQEYSKAYAVYTSAYSDFENAVKNYNFSVSSFNNIVAAFNEAVKNYNYLINLD
jgi:hypothetical protein